MKILSWNLNGLLSCVRNNAFAIIDLIQPDILCLQEIRTMQEPEILGGYWHFWNHCDRDGYSGTAMLTKENPLSIQYGFDSTAPDQDGRLITAEFDGLYVVNVYVPNSQRDLMRHAYRMEWDARLREYVNDLRESKPVIICGDFNVAREDLDIYPENMRQYWAEHGYISDERSNMETLIEDGFMDAFRELHPDERSYTWWSNRLNKRKQDRGWRLDYFLVDDELQDLVIDVRHLKEIHGSDHCPIELELRR